MVTVTLGPGKWGSMVTGALDSSFLDSPGVNSSGRGASTGSTSATPRLVSAAKAGSGAEAGTTAALVTARLARKAKTVVAFILKMEKVDGEAEGLNLRIDLLSRLRCEEERRVMSKECDATRV